MIFSNFLLTFLISITGIFCCASAALYYNDDGNDLWGEEEVDYSDERIEQRERLEHFNSLEVFDDENRNRPLLPVKQKNFFKRFDLLQSLDEPWANDFYTRQMAICSHKTLPLLLYKLEGGNASSCPNGGTVAVGRFRNSQNETGWGVLELETFKDFPAEIQSYAAGLVEGSLTKIQIQNHEKNTAGQLCKNATSYCKKLFPYIQKNLEWIESECLKRNKTDLFWYHVNLTYTQLTGINDGYRSEKAIYLPNVRFAITPILLIQMSGEFFDLEHVFKKSPNLENEPSHCSGFIKVTEGNKDLLMSHVSMAGYQTMTRLLKLYKFAFDPQESPGRVVSFSGYPAALSSADDYTLTSGGLLSIETTIAVFDETIYEKVKPFGQLHCWLRSYLANRLSATARDWVRLFGRYNSGTYNNQWTVLDYKLFKPEQELPESDLIWILEQIPGFVESRDVTWFLRRYRYWPSYNIPFLAKVSELSGFSTKANVNNWWRWGFTPRAKIFHRDHEKVKDLGTLRALMRYNDYKHEEFSRCKCAPPYTAEASISTRGDLNPQNGTWEVPGMSFRNHGGIDYKGTNYELFKQLRFEVVGGPTYGGPGALPYFSWATTKVDAQHLGQPTEWKFTDFVTQWQAEISSNIVGD